MFLRKYITSKLLKYQLAFQCEHGASLALSEFDFPDKTKPIFRKDLGFIFQGPIADPALLLNGLANYRAIFPNATIILSTWAIPDNFGRAISSLDIDVVIPEAPKSYGLLGVNLQITGVSAALDLLGKKFSSDALVMKIRTDLFPRYPFNIILTIDAFSKIFSDDRLWVVDSNTKKYIPYSISDIFNCGRLDSMTSFWTRCQHSEFTISRQKYYKITSKSSNIEKIIDLGCPEIYLTTSYLRTIGVDYDKYSLEMYYGMLGKYFGVLDANQIGLGIDKYTIFRSGQFVNEPLSNKSISVPEWLSYCVI